MRYGSVCSGIEAATAAWHHMGWEPAFFSEIEKFPRAVLEHRYPNVPLHGDFTTLERNQYGHIDLLVGGTPCQSFSVAGLRGGLDDDRGNLALEFCRLAQRERPRWIVWENVPGVLSSGGGRDFGSILGALEDLGYGLAYRVLDAQFFGVAQRRRRVFVVGYLGDWRPAAAVLFERHSMSGHPAPSREARQDVTHATAPCLTGSGRGVERTGDTRGQDPVVAVGRERSGVDVAPTMQAGGNSTGGTRPYGTTVDTCEALIASTFNEDGTARTLTARYDSSPCVDRGPDVVGTLTRASSAGGTITQQDVSAGHIIVSDVPDVVGTLRTKRPGEGGVQGDFDHIVPVVSPALNTQSGSHHAPDTKAYVAFAQNTRDEVRLVNGDGQIVGALAAQPGMKQTSYIAFSSMNAFRSPDAAASTGLGVGDDGEAMYTLTKENHHAVAFQLNGDRHNPGVSVSEDVAFCLPANPMSDRGQAVAQPVAFSSNMSEPDCQTDGTTPTLKLGGHGGGNPPAVAFDTTQITSPHNYSNPQPGDPCHPLAAGAHPPAVAWSIMPMNSGKDYKARETEVAQPIMAGGPVGGNQGGDFVIAFHPTQDPISSVDGSTHAPDTGSAGGCATVAVFVDVYNGAITGDVSATVGASGSPVNSAGPQVMTAVVYPIISDADRADSAAKTPSPDAEGRVRLRDPGLGVGGEADPMYTLQATKPHAVAYGVSESPDLGHCLRSGASRADKHESTTYVATAAVRRLTPTECERLQGFPDGFTAIPWRKKGAEDCPDGPRYKALGNSMAVPVMRWIGERIQLIDDFIDLF